MIPNRANYGGKTRRTSKIHWQKGRSTVTGQCRSRERERPRGTIVMCRQNGPRTALSHRICTGIGRRKLGKLIEELAPLWLAQQESRLRDRRGRDRLRAEGAGPGRELPFTDRVIATLVILRFQLPHAALAVLYGVHRSTLTARP